MCGIPAFTACHPGLAYAVPGAVLAATFVGALAAAPNNWDSMTYHMSRVAHWIQNGGVAHYPTTIDRQLFLSPWAEFAILQFQGLTGGDRWANLIQWASMVGCMCCASLIAKQLGGKWSVQLSTAAIVAAIPMGILQSSTTQNDYVTAFWFVCFVHYTLHLSSSPSSGPRVSAPLAGASLGLMLLTMPCPFWSGCRGGACDTTQSDGCDCW